jgi:hypothetical protein
VALAVDCEVNVGLLPAPIIDDPDLYISILTVPVWSAANPQFVIVALNGIIKYPAVPVTRTCF